MATITNKFATTATKYLNDLLIKDVLSTIVQHVNATRPGAGLTVEELLSEACLGMSAPSMVPSASAVIPSKPPSSLNDNLISKVGLCQRVIGVTGKVCGRPLKTGCDACGIHSRKKAVKTTPVQSDTPSIVATAGYVSPATSAIVPQPPKRTITVRPGQGGLGLIEGVEELKTILVRTTSEGKYIAVGHVKADNTISANLSPAQQKSLTEYGIPFETTMPSAGAVGVANTTGQPPQLPRLPDLPAFPTAQLEHALDPDDLPGDDIDM